MRSRIINKNSRMDDGLLSMERHQVMQHSAKWRWARKLCDGRAACPAPDQCHHIAAFELSSLDRHIALTSRSWHRLPIVGFGAPHSDHRFATTVHHPLPFGPSRTEQAALAEIGQCRKD
jgi:hypothetical protein